MRFSVFWGAVLHSILASLLVLCLSVPLIFLLHAHFELGQPPEIGLVSLCVGVTGVILGSALLGVWWGMMRGERASGTSAAVLGLIWGIVLSLGLSISYSRQVSTIATRQVALQADESRQRVEAASREISEQASAGHASKEATLSALQLSNKAAEATVSGTSKLPAMGLLIWTIMLPPLLCAFECRRARV